MADVAHMYDNAVIHFASGEIPWLAASTDFYMALCTAGYTPDRATDDVYGDITDELPTALGYVAGGQQLTGVDISVGTDVYPYNYVRLFSDDMQWGAVDPAGVATFTSVKTVVIYYNGATKYLLGYTTYDEVVNAIDDIFLVYCPDDGWLKLEIP